MFSFTDWLFENKDALGTGPGLWCPLHIALVVIMLVWLVVAFFIFRKYKNFALKFTFVLCIIMPAVRILRMIVQLASGDYSFVEVLPWHLCHLMSFVLPIFYFTKTKKFFLPVLVASFFGGVITFIFGDYYYLSTLSFYHVESIILHFALSTAVIACIADGYFKVSVKDFWQAYVGMFIIALWSSLGNALVEGANFLYLKENGLPFTLFGLHFYFTYFILVLVCSVVAITPFAISEYIKKKKRTSFDIIMDVVRNKNFA